METSSYCNTLDLNQSVAMRSQREYSGTAEHMSLECQMEAQAVYMYVGLNEVTK